MNQNNPNPNYFKGVKTGDMVYLLGWGIAKVTLADPQFKTFKIKVQEPGGLEQDVNYSGFVNNANYKTVFWQKPEIIDLGRSEMLIDTLVWVWDKDKQGQVLPNQKYVRHFSHFDDRGKLHTFSNGANSFTVGGMRTRAWDEWAIVSEEEMIEIRAKGVQRRN